MMKMLILAAALALVGCSSTPKVSAKKPQYCHTSQTITSENNNKVNSQTVVECTDDQIKRLTATRAGFSASCGEFTYWMQIGGNNVQRKGVSCQRPDGSWEVVDVVGR